MYQKKTSGKCGLFIIEFGFSSRMERANTYLTDADRRVNMFFMNISHSQGAEI